MANAESPRPPFTVRLNWREIPNNPEFIAPSHYLGKKFALTLGVTINPLDSDRIIINYPGLNENGDGINFRYTAIARQMQIRGLGSVVRCGNPDLSPFLPTTHLKKTVDFSIKNSYSICKHSKPELLLMGFSAGASAIATLAASYERISRILLIAPSGDMPKELVESGLGQFRGEVYILIGEDDEVVGAESGRMYFNLALSASHRELLTIHNCGHYFQGAINDMIFREAPFYAFAQGEKPKFP